MARIAYFVHGRGRGHAARARAVLAALEAEGHALAVHGGGQAASLLGSRPDFEAVRAVLPGPGLLPSIVARLPADLRRFRRTRPDVVISDSDLTSVHAAAMLGIPTLALGHGLVFANCALPPGLPRLGLLRETLNSGSSSWIAWRKVVVHFADARVTSKSAVLARPDLRDGLAPSTADDGFVLTYFRDDNGQDVLRALLQAGRRVVCFTDGPVPEGVDKRAPSAVGFAEALARCTAVVASAGNHLPAECAMVGKPLLGVYDAGDLEQRMNGLLLEHAGFGLTAPLGAVTPALLGRFFGERFPRPGVGEAVRALPPVSAVVPSLVREALAGARGRGSERHER
ncbi:MAG: glycosyltransferase family protein [Myxococcota bacterium]